MSRLIVKNLPKSVTETKLRELFSQKGFVTDVQLKYTKDGKFRRFCFIGYKTEDEAVAARDYFNKSCIDTCRISVEQCAGLGDPSKPRSWSKYAPDSSHDKLSNKPIKSNEKEVEDKDDKKKNKTKEANAEVSQRKEKKKKNKEKEQNNEIKEALKKHKDDPLFIEFLESHSVPSAKLMIDENGDVNKENNDYKENTDVMSDEETDVQDENESEDEKQKVANIVTSDLQYMEALKKKVNKVTDLVVESKKSHGPKEFFNVKVRGLGYGFKKKHIKQFFHPLKAKSIRLPPKIKGIAYVGFKTKQQMAKALLKNKSFLDGKQLFVSKYEKKEDTNTDKNDETNNNNNVKWKKQEEALKNEESIAESGRMFIRNLAYTTTEEDVRKLFEKYGPLTEVDLPVDKVTRKPKGFGTITFLMPEHATKAFSELDGSILNGRMLHILPGKAKANPLDKLEQSGLSYKQKKELLNKATAQSSHNWNTLFLGQNAVADAMAASYNTTKEKILEDGTKGMSAAVKLALGETQLVQDTRKFLEDNHVRLDAFDQPPEKRSKTIILVKNLPAGTTVQELRELFVKHGELGRIVMPPSGITALVEFLEPSEARRAFTKLAYTKFKYLPLYLEWAPENSFTTEPPKSKNDKSVTNSDKTSEAVEKIHTESANIENNVEENDNNDDEDEPEPDTTLFVKNINFSTTEDELKEYFSKCGPLQYATIATKKDPNNPGNKLSMGYGFVRYKIKADADRALKTLQMSVLAGKTLELKRSERTLTTDVKSTKKAAKATTQISNKILVRNVPFQATVEEVTELFKAFGELKAVRLPKKFVGAEKHRGFAFVEYYTKSEAKKAFKALCQSTHLYGRRLVLEWAQTEEGIEEIRKRTAKHFHEDIPTKRSKKAVMDPEVMDLNEEAE